MRPILIIEDAPYICDALRARLEIEGFAARVASSAEEALRALGGLERPCVVLVDPFMHALRGWDLVSLLEPDDVVATIPVHFVGDGDRVLKEAYALDALVEVIRDHCHPRPAHTA